MAFFFSRDTKVFMSWSYDGSAAKTALYEIPVLDGFSFSQGTNTSEVTLSEAANSTGGSKRGRAMFTDSFAPAEWSFSTYMRPTVSGTGSATTATDGVTNGQHGGNADKFAIEGPLWAAMSANTYDRATGASSSDKSDYEPNVFNFANSNQVTLGVFDLFFVLGASKDSEGNTYTTGTDGVTVYKLANCSVGSASIDFDIEGLAQIAWSGNGQSIEEVASLETRATDSGNSITGTTTLGIVNEGISSTSNYIRQKLTDLAITFDHSASTGTLGALAGDGTNDVTYNVTLTGGTITINDGTRDRLVIDANDITMTDESGNTAFNLDTNVLTLGEVASNQENIVIDPTNGVRLRTNTTTHAQLTADKFVMGEDGNSKSRVEVESGGVKIINRQSGIAYKDRDTNLSIGFSIAL